MQHGAMHLAERRGVAPIVEPAEQPTDRRAERVGDPAGGDGAGYGASAFGEGGVGTVAGFDARQAEHLADLLRQTAQLAETFGHQPARGRGPRTIATGTRRLEADGAERERAAGA